MNPEDNGKLNELLERARKKCQEKGTEGTPSEQTTPITTSTMLKTISADELNHAGIKSRYKDVTFSAIEKRGLPDDSCIRSNYRQVKAYAERLDDYTKNGVGLVLVGGYGTMKTTMVVAVLRKWLDEGHHGLIVPMCSLVDNLFTLMHLNREEMAKYEHRIRTTKLLILDDLGGENTDQKWVLAKIDSIITERYNDKLATIITTNLSAKELAGTYSGRMLDRLKNTAMLLVFDTDSQRRHMWEA